MATDPQIFQVFVDGPPGDEARYRSQFVVVAHSGIDARNNVLAAFPEFRERSMNFQELGRVAIVRAVAETQFTKASK